ncbi:flagellar basal body rod protein FlgB [Paenibacillus antri]|uniref:Flagellar basal body rod protein FlgB n=1 Tax=Paenibacillus antri TaxID=2582848 RepID=A0A5R9G9V0_9BACL|nr:flagellar basal body rod protein FlgB [Paenibacillus antri]TLS49854.1 flagellar basal body rod protein FlgB [Paenibacillus antri]
MLNVNGSHFRLLERTLDASSLRQAVIANNIANVDTPRFKRSEVQFETLLQQSMNGMPGGIVGRRTDPRHIYIGRGGKEVEPIITIDENSVMNNNLNNVDIDSEMSAMAKNQLRYNTLVQQVSHEIKLTKTALEAR